MPADPRAAGPARPPTLRALIPAVLMFLAVATGAWTTTAAADDPSTSSDTTVETSDATPDSTSEAPAEPEPTVAPTSSAPVSPMPTAVPTTPPAPRTHGSDASDSDSDDSDSDSDSSDSDATSDDASDDDAAPVDAPESPTPPPTGGTVDIDPESGDLELQPFIPSVVQFNAFDLACDDPDNPDCVDDPPTDAIVPVAAFTATPTAGSAPLTVTFTNESFCPDDFGQPCSYEWDFGDGETSNDANPEPHVYEDATAAGEPYYVTLTISQFLTGSDNEPYQDRTDRQAIEVYEADVSDSDQPNDDPSRFPTSTDGPSGVDAAFTPKVKPGSFSVTFTNGSSCQLRASDCTDQLRYAWTFGDGRPGSSATSPTHVFPGPGTYHVTLAADYPEFTFNGCAENPFYCDTAEADVTITGPNASFTATPTSGAAPLKVTFKDTSTGDIASRSWAFTGACSGAAGSTQAQLQRTFTAPGNCVVTLTVRPPAGPKVDAFDPACNCSRASKTIRILPVVVSGSDSDSDSDYDADEDSDSDDSDSVIIPGGVPGGGSGAVPGTTPLDTPPLDETPGSDPSDGATTAPVDPTNPGEPGGPSEPAGPVEPSVPGAPGDADADNGSFLSSNPPVSLDPRLAGNNADLGGGPVLAVTLMIMAAVVGSVGRTGGLSMRGRQVALIADRDENTVARHVAARDAEGWGDRSFTWRFPGHRALDAASVVLPDRLARFSPLIGRVTEDGSEFRAMFGTLWFLTPLAGAAVGVATALAAGGRALPPSLWLLVAGIVLATFDAFSGALAIAVFGGAVLIGSAMGVGDSPDLVHSLLVVLAMGFLWMAIPLIGSAIRPFRRLGDWSLRHRWDVAADGVIAALLCGWVAQKLVKAMDLFAGRPTGLPEHANTVALVVMGAVALRVATEHFSNLAYPRRLQEVEGEDPPPPFLASSIVGALLRTAVFGFFGYAFIGSCWQLWLGIGLFLIPQLISHVRESFGNVEFIQRILPRGIVEIFILIVACTLAARFAVTENGDGLSGIRLAFLLIAIPPALIGTLALLTDGDEEGEEAGHRPWSREFLGAVIVVVTTVLAARGWDY